jgi:hypothetical protein
VTVSVKHKSKKSRLAEGTAKRVTARTAAKPDPSAFYTSSLASPVQFILTVAVIYETLPAANLLVL